MSIPVVCEEGVFVWRKKGDTRQTIWREIRPEHSIAPDDDLYGSPRSWMGATMQGGGEPARDAADANRSVGQADEMHRTSFEGESELARYYRDRRDRPWLPTIEPAGRDPAKGGTNGHARSAGRPAQAGNLDRRTEPRAASTLTLQTAGSIFLLAAAFLLFHSQRPFADAAKLAVRTALNTDYASVELPAHVAAMFGAIPSSGSATVKAAAVALDVVTPLKGPIIRGYSVVAPEVVILGRPGSPVDAAADGLVDTVGESQANGLYVTIDHGSFGQTFYAHLGRLVVHDHEYVTAGQVIGYLPSGSGQLTFGYIQGGSYKNPQLILHARK